jgi:translocator protein
MYAGTIIDRSLDRSVALGYANVGLRRAGAPWRTYALTGVAVAVTAAAGAAAVDPDSAWYRDLSKPAWQPPSRAFGIIWTPLYASIAWAGGRALRQAAASQRSALIASLAANLALNTAWNWMFFGLRSPRAGMAGTVLLDISNVELIRRTVHIDPGAAQALIPYALWCAFATALNADIARRNSRAS